MFDSPDRHSPDMHSPDMHSPDMRSLHESVEGDRLRRAVHALVASPPSRPEADTTAESRERLALTGERPIWVAQDAAHAAFVREVGAYARALRDGGMPSRRVLAVVGAVVHDAAAPSLAAGPLAALVHDAGRSCVAAYFAR